MSQCHQLHAGEGLSRSLQELEEAFRDIDHESEAKERNLQVDQHEPDGFSLKTWSITVSAVVMFESSTQQKLHAVFNCN